MQPEAIKEAVRNQFVSLLAESGTNQDEPELFRAWQAFKAFAHARVEQTHGGLLFECGPNAIGENPDHFSLHFLRFFYLEVEESWDDVLVDCDFEFGPNPELSQFKVSIDVDAGAVPEPAEFIAQVEAHQGLWQALWEHPARRGSVYIGEQ